MVRCPDVENGVEKRVRPVASNQSAYLVRGRLKKMCWGKDAGSKTLEEGRKSPRVTLLAGARSNGVPKAPPMVTSARLEAGETEKPNKEKGGKEEKREAPSGSDRKVHDRVKPRRLAC